MTQITTTHSDQAYNWYNDPANTKETFAAYAARFGVTLFGDARTHDDHDWADVVMSLYDRHGQDGYIRAYLADRYGVEIDCVVTGAEADEDISGMYHGEPNAWIVNGRMPNSNVTGWFFAGYSDDIIRDAQA